MIIKMKKITLVCLDAMKNQALEALRDLGTMHVSVNLNIDSRTVASAGEDLERMDAILRDLDTRKIEHGAKTEQSPSVLFSEAGQLLADHFTYEKKLENLTKEELRLEPWGSFSSAQIDGMKKDGIFVTLCTASPSFVPDFPAEVLVRRIHESKTAVCYALIAGTDSLELPSGMTPFSLPDVSLNEIRDRISALRKEEAERQKKLDHLAAFRDLFAEYRTSLQETYDFVMNRDNMAVSGILAHINGYVPVDTVASLQALARKEGWGLLMEDPSADDNQVPTYIRKPKWLDIMDPLFDFIGVSPGYRENDVNVFFLIFFPIFFGMIIGDTVYGLLFLVSALIGKMMLRNKPSARLPLNLFLLLACCSITWGWLNGSWAGIPAKNLPSWMTGWAFLSDPANSPFAIELAKKLAIIKPETPVDTYAQVFEAASWNGKIVQWLCFFLAAVHLTSARIFKFVLEIGSNWRAFGHIGWGLLIVANFLMAVNLIVFSGTFPHFGYYLYGIGTALVVITVTFDDALNLPFALIGSFTDVLSYIRLYAVGLAGSLIAIKFNEMGLMMTEGKSGAVFYLALIALILIALFGHLLNIALGFLSVMVHGIRLNTLEFSNHIGMQWAGIKYKPFDKKNKDNKK